MENRVFGRQYAEAYDVLYRDKDYEAECDTIEKIFRIFAKKPIKTVLDLGCGTGNHAIPLSRRGYHVTGVDRSAGMIDKAKRKTEIQHFQLSKTLRFIQADIRSINLDQSFNAVIAMFAVLGYQNTNNDLSSTLKSIRNHLTTDGIFIFDVWYGPAVLAIGPEKRVKEIPIDNGKLIRMASAELNLKHNLCEVRYRMQKISGDQLENESDERHVMRYFFLEELRSILFQNHLRLKSLRSLPDPMKFADETTWNTIGVAKAF